MRNRFELGGREYTVTAWHAALPDERSVHPSVALSLFRGIVLEGIARHRLRSWLADAGVDLTHIDELEALEQALSSGRLVVVEHDPEELRPSPTLVSEAEAEETEEQGPEPAAEHDFIEIELADEDGALIQGAELELTLPDGTVRRARTDDRGRFFVPRTDPGQCTLRWISLHSVERAPQFADAQTAEA